jgi:hypothetical protein
MVIFIILFLVICGAVGVGIYQRPAGFFLGLFFGPIGIVISAILSLDTDYKAEKKATDIKREAERQEFLEKCRIQLAKEEKERREVEAERLRIQKIKNTNSDKHWDEMKRREKSEWILEDFD